MTDNDIKYLTNVPKLLNKFTNVKKELKLGSDIKELICKKGPLSEQSKQLLDKIEFNIEEETTSLYLTSKTEMSVDIYLTIPRGIRVDLRAITINDCTRIELCNNFNIYGSEGFTLCISNTKTAVVVEPVSASGTKGVFCVDVYGYDFEGDSTVVKDDLSNYMDVSPILKNYRG